MMFFRRRNRKAIRQEPTDDEELPYRSSLSRFDGDLTAFRANGVAMKVWLPEPVDEILKQLSDHWPISRSSMIRDTLFIYAYGQYAFAQMKAEKDGFFYVNPEPALFSRARDTFSDLGKNIKSYKVWMPAKLRDDLKVMAEAHDLTLSHYVRKVLISSFMGHMRLPAREQASRDGQNRPVDWPPDAED